MSIDFTVKPAGAPVTTPIIRPEPEAARTAVATDLPAPQSVTAAETSAAATATRTGTNPDISRQVIFDQAAAQMVYVAVDKDTQEVLSQYPESWQLKARAYFREVEQSKAQRIGSLATDRIA
jgi:hypothetical protein